MSTGGFDDTAPTAGIDAHDIDSGRNAAIPFKPNEVTTPIGYEAGHHKRVRKLMRYHAAGTSDDAFAVCCRRTRIRSRRL
jgi:hypothetical protein